jgi:hypothetical protein
VEKEAEKKGMGVPSLNFFAPRCIFSECLTWPFLFPPSSLIGIVVVVIVVIVSAVSIFGSSLR